MQIMQPLESGSPAPAFRQIKPEDRARLSGPGLRTFRNIAERWGLNEADRIAALGYPGRSTYHSWMKKAVGGEKVSLPFDTLLRISAILGIHKGLSILFHEETQALQWLTSVHLGTDFAGRSPLSLIVENGQDGMMIVRRYIDAWRGGSMGHSAPEGSFEPVTEDDVVFV